MILRSAASVSQDKQAIARAKSAALEIDEGVRVHEPGLFVDRFARCHVLKVFQFDRLAGSRAWQ
jgi:hypothetical protein